MPISDAHQRRADDLGVPDEDALAEPVSWRHIDSECANCGRPIFTNGQVSARANPKQDAWRHSDTAQQRCQAL